MVFISGVVIFVKKLTGETIIVEVDESNTLENVKDRVQSKAGVPCDQQMLMLEGKQEDGQRLCDYGVHGGSTLLLIQISEQGTYILLF